MGAPRLSSAPLTNKAARRQIPFRLLGGLGLCSLGVFLGLTAIELWAPRAAVRLASWGLLPWATVLPARPAERPERGFPVPMVLGQKDVRLEGPKDRPLIGVSGRSDPGSPMGILIPGESVNMGIKVGADARRRDRISGRGAEPVTAPAVAEVAVRARARADAAADVRRAVLAHRFRLALAIAAAGAFFMFVSSGFLASLFRPHPGTLRDKQP